VPEESYIRGREAGAVDTRLEQHEERLHTLNGHLADVGEELRKVGLTLQSISDKIDAAAAKALATAEALADASTARRESDREAKEKEEGKWSPLQKVFGTIGAIAALMAALAAILHYVH